MGLFLRKFIWPTRDYVGSHRGSPEEAPAVPVNGLFWQNEPKVFRDISKS